MMSLHFLSYYLLLIHTCTRFIASLKDGQLTPAGRGLLDPTNNEKGKCDFRGIRVLAEEAMLSGKAELFQCQSTGTKMIKRLGKNQSTATFTVNVESAGDYAVNVSLMNVGREFRHLGISLNDGLTQVFAVGETAVSYTHLRAHET